MCKEMRAKLQETGPQSPLGDEENLKTGLRRLQDAVCFVGFVKRVVFAMCLNVW